MSSNSAKGDGVVKLTIGRGLGCAVCDVTTTEVPAERLYALLDPLEKWIAMHHVRGRVRRPKKRGYEFRIERYTLKMCLDLWKRDPLVAAALLEGSLVIEGDEILDRVVPTGP